MTAIAFDAASSVKGSGVSSRSWSHTCSGSERLLVVCTNSGDTNPADRPVNSITYNGVNLTKIRSDDGSNSRTELWYLVNPVSGANTIQVNFNGSNIDVQVGGISLTGVDQTTALDAHNGASGSSSSPSVAVTTVADNAWVVDVLMVANAPSITAGAGQTQRWSENNGNSRGRGSSEGPKTPAGSVTMSWSLGSSQAWRTSAASFAPASNVAVLPPVLGQTVTFPTSKLLWTSYPARLSAALSLLIPKRVIVITASALSKLAAFFLPILEIKFVTRLRTGRRSVHFMMDEKQTLFTSKQRDTQIIVRSKRK